MHPSSSQKKQHGLNIQFFYLFFELLRHSIWNFNPKHSFTRKCINCFYNSSWFILLILCFSAELYIGNEVGKLSGRMTLVLNSDTENHFRSVDNFLAIVAIGLGWILFINLVKTIRQFIQEGLSIQWRHQLTQNLHFFYLHQSNFYRMVILEQQIDNPDHRITIDTSNCIRNISDILSKVLDAPMNIIFYTIATYQTVGWQGPLICYVFFVLGSVLNRVLISPIVQLWFQQESLEGTFRFSHAALRLNSESVSFYKGENRELELQNRNLSQLISNRWKISLRNIILNFHMNFFGYVGGIMSYLIVGFGAYVLRTFEDIADPKQIVFTIQIFSFQCIMLIYGFTEFIQLGSLISELAGNSDRVGELLVDFYRSNTTKHTRGVTINPLVDSITFCNVDIKTPSESKLLLKDLNVKFEKGQNILITGRSGIGKSSLLRVLADLWPLYHKQDESSSMIIERPQNMLFVPQNAYVIYGTLRELVTYPMECSPSINNTLIEEAIEEEAQIMEALVRADLGYLIQQNLSKIVDRAENWINILSAGEKQKLSFARLFYHLKRKRILHEKEWSGWVCLDESTNALDIPVERKLMLELLKEQVNVITISHRDTLQDLHSHELHLLEDGEYCFGELQKK